MSAAISSNPMEPPEATEPSHYEAGRLVGGKFELVRELGHGGMGVVWVAHNRVLDVHVAIKIIDLARAPSPKRLADRVLQEARASARLAHPAICRVFEYGATNAGDPFIVSELLHGDTLGDVLMHQPRLSATRAVQVLLPVIEGLVMAHGRGVVHRDVKPENIFLSRDEVSRLRPKLLDFGIARMIDADRKITIDGTLLGTPDYMSPEQARGEGDVDARTDIWSVCVVLYESITGARPFDGNNYNALLWAICHEAPKSLADHGAGDDRLWAILRTGLEKDREARWGSMRQLGVALAQWLLRSGIDEDVCGFSLRSTWLAQDGRVALSQAPLAGDSRSDANAQPTAGRTATGVFEKPPAVGGRRKVPLGYWLVGGATALVLVSGLGLALALMAGPRSFSESGTGAPIDEPVSPVPVAPRTTARTLAPMVSLPLAVAPSASASASATPSGSAPASAPAYRPRRPVERRLDPDTYDFGF